MTRCCSCFSSSQTESTKDRFHSSSHDVFQSRSSPPKPISSSQNEFTNDEFHSSSNDVFHSQSSSPKPISSSQTEFTDDGLHSSSYDVFISFIDGYEDNRSGFFYHLLCSLQSAGLTVYRDVDGHRKQLLRENNFSSSLLKNTMGSKVCIIIFSRAFASSRCCLEEVGLIMERHRTIGQIVLPVFYNVHQAEVRTQSGTFGEDFVKLLREISATKQKELSWRRALTKAASLNNGWHLKDSLRVEMETIDSIRETIAKTVESTHLFVAEHPVGIQPRVREITQLLTGGLNVITVGIWGMAGIGKTTIAKAVYNEIGHQYEARSFLENVRDVWKLRNGQADLKQQLLSDILNTRDVVWHGTEIETITKEKGVGHKRALIVFDDLNQLDQLGELCGIKQLIGPGSVIIITARDKHLLQTFGVAHIREIKELDKTESVVLFLWHASGNLHPMGWAIYDLQLKRNPLALEVLGSHLYRTLRDEWKGISSILESILHNDLQDIIKFCYEGLDKSSKDTFLNICCFFVGKDRSYVTQILNDHGLCGEMLIRTLVEQKLVMVDKNNKLGMHGFLQEMGQAIIRKRSLAKWTYTVFLSFRGKETRRSFVSHLYAALTNAGIKVFMDDRELESGENISLMRAIEGSRISIIIFSKNYACSKWCLEELEKIIECHRTKYQEILPIFYDVDPSEIRHQRGNFGEVFQQLVERTSANKYEIMNWRRALTEVANLSGLDSRIYRNDQEIIDDILEIIAMKLDDNMLFVAEHPVGVESRVKDMIALLSGKSNDVRMIGLLGMGGVGKTTTAKAIYNEIGRDFDVKSFLANIRETWEKEHGTIDLQERLLSSILKSRRMKLDDVDYGKILIKGSLSRKRLLLVLDDVNEVDQLHALCGNGEWLAPGSILIITTRNEHILNFLGVKDVYRIEPLNEEESIELFSWNAFKQSYPEDKFNVHSKDIVAYCGGLPLALEILGSFFFGRGTSDWESALVKLKRIPHNQIKEKLKISFDGLNDDTEKEIFLHISCFFIGMDRNYVTQILNDCGLHAQIGISVLKEKSLITIDKKNKLGMHDLLRDMGRDIVREESPNEPGNRSRLCWYDEVLDVLKKHTGTKAIEGLALSMRRTKKICLSTKTFKKMKRLKLLQLGHVQLDGDYEYLSRDLRWLCWHEFPLKFIPANFYQESLVVLELKYSNLRLLWKETKLLEKLKILNLSHSHHLKQSPDFSNMPNLEKLILKDCPKMSIVHHSIGDLKDLYLVNLKDCTSIVNLPRSIYKLKSLKTLILSGCSEIDKLEDYFEQMDSLTTLLADNTAIAQVPYSIVRSQSIGYISLCGFEGLSEEVFPSLIWSWMSPMNSPKSLGTYGAMSSLVSVGLENKYFFGQPGFLPDQPNLKSIRLQSFSQNLTKDVTRIFEALYAPSSSTEMETTANFSQAGHVETSLNSLLIQMGACNEVIDTLRECILQEPNFPSNNYPHWLTYTNERSSVSFKVPEISDCTSEGMMLHILYSSDRAKNVATECVPHVWIVNLTMGTIQFCKRDALTTFEDEEWRSLISTLQPNNEVLVFVALGDSFIVKNTTIYLVFGELNERRQHLLLEEKNASSQESQKGKEKL